MRRPQAVLLFLLLCGSLPSASIQSKCDVKCLTPKTCIMTETGDTHSIECQKNLGMRLDNDDYYNAGQKWMCNYRENGDYWVDTEFKDNDRNPPKTAAWRTIKTVECVEKFPCHLMNPLVSSCRDSIVCQQIVSLNSETVKCDQVSEDSDDFKLYVTHSVTKEMQTVPFVECNDKTGMWTIKNHSGYYPLPKGSIIRCVRPFEHEEADKFKTGNDTKYPQMQEEINAENAKIRVREYYQTGALLCLLSCFLSAGIAWWMYECRYVPRIKAYKHEWSGKQIHAGWRENYGRPRPKRRLWIVELYIRVVNWYKYMSGTDIPPPTLQNVYDDVSTCVSLTEESDFSDCEDCDNCKICPDWMDCGSLDDLADRCSTCSGGEACCSISTCSCTGPQPETTALSFSGTDNSEFEEILDDEYDEKDKCKCTKIKRCDDRTCCILSRIPKRKPMKGHLKKAKVAAKVDKKLKASKEWQDFYASTNARLMGINNETKLQI